MNISCSICAELFRSPDAHRLHVTRCGHVFHNECLSKWLERNNTCPECRSKTTKSTVMRLYVNVIDRNPDDNINGDTDFLYIQNENDNLKFRLIEKDGALKSKEEALDRLRDENQKLSNEQVKARKIILALEEKNETNGIVIKTHNEQIKALRSRLTEVDQLKVKLKEATEKNRAVELVQNLIISSQQETEELLREGRTNNELATMVTTLKRELLNSKAKLDQKRSNAEDLTKQLRSCKMEKIKLEEKCSILESRVFQLESNNVNKNDSTDDSLNNSENTNENKSPTDRLPNKRTFGEHSMFHRKVVALESYRKTSPSTSIKASSIGGLSPLLKRTKSAESYKLSPLSKDAKSETFSILQKPRLINHQTKKSVLRPSRLEKKSVMSTLSSVNENPAADQAKSTNFTFSNMPNSQMTNLNNRFRMGALSKPN